MGSEMCIRDRSHKLTRKILGKSFIWNKLIKQILPKDSQYTPEEEYAVLASEREKMKLLSVILSLGEDSDRSELGMDLIHTICERHPILDPNSSRGLVDVGCSCGQTHTVSLLGFLLLKEVESREHVILSDDRVKVNEVLLDPFLTAISSLVAVQQDNVKNLDVGTVSCRNKETAEATVSLDGSSAQTIATAITVSYTHHRAHETDS